ncbi:MAG: hypothetical protein ACOYMG_13275, partial [Candidatus Methylumidiphilus sp.]
PSAGTPMDPAKDGCGLIWYSPLVPMKPEAVMRYVEMVRAVCLQYRMEPLITLTSLSDRCFDSTVPLLFDRAKPAEVERANECYLELLEAGLKQGFIPYRLSVRHMDMLESHGGIPNCLQDIKRALDPGNILAPGRYVTIDGSPVG